MPEPGFISLSGLRRPESCGGRGRGSGRSFIRCLTRSEIKEALRGATGELVADITQEIKPEKPNPNPNPNPNWDKLEPLIPPDGSPVTIGGSPQRVQANHQVDSLTHALGGLRSRPLQLVQEAPSYQQQHNQPTAM